MRKKKVVFLLKIYKDFIEAWMIFLGHIKWEKKQDEKEYAHCIRE